MSEKNTDGMDWYFVQTHSSYEKRAKVGLLEQAKLAGLEDELGDVVIPMEDIVEMKGGEKKTRQRKFFPGYMLVQMRMTKPMWHVIRKTPRIIGFVGGSKDPTPLPQHEVDKILGKMEEGAQQPKPVLSFEVGDQVRVIDGPFKNFNGSVEEVNPDKQKVRVLVSIFGRATPVELDFIQVEAIDD
jgi:transcriptional antiterminator NusG